MSTCCCPAPQAGASVFSSKLNSTGGLSISMYVFIQGVLTPGAPVLFMGNITQVRRPERSDMQSERSPRPPQSSLQGACGDTAAAVAGPGGRCKRADAGNGGRHGSVQAAAAVPGCVFPTAHATRLCTWLWRAGRPRGARSTPAARPRQQRRADGGGR